MFDWEELDKKIFPMLESGAKLRDIATDTGVAYKTLTAHLRAVGYRRNDGTLEYQIVRCYFHNCDKFSGDIVTAICDRYELTPEELKELIERETATVVECYKVQRSFQRTRAALVDRYGVKPSDQFIHGVLERFGVDVLISPEPTQVRSRPQRRVLRILADGRTGDPTGGDSLQDSLPRKRQRVSCF